MAFSASDAQPGTIGLAQSRDLYNASAYFSPFYFYGGSSRVPSESSSQVTGRDGPYYAELVGRIRSLNSFDTVIFGDPTSQAGRGANAHPVAIVVPRGWDETDETDPVLWVRRVLFTVRIVVRVEDSSVPFDQLDQLATLVQTEVDQADLGDQCIPALTKIRTCRYGASSQYPDWSIDLDGEFAVLVDPSVDRIPL